MTVRKCKFCGCSEHHACSIPIRLDDDEEKFEIWFGAVVQLDLDIDYIRCAWLLKDVCTNPSCVEKAYAEARDLATALERQVAA